MRAKLAVGIVCALVGLALGFGAGWGLSRSEGETHLSRSFCVKCGMQRSQESVSAPIGELYRKEMELGGAVFSLMNPVVGTHNHVWTPWHQISPFIDPATLGVEARMERQIMQMSLDELDSLNNWAEGLGMLSAAFFNDRERASAFVQKILDPEAHVDPMALMIIKRDADWPLRWKLIEVFLKTYRCEKLPTGVTCTIQNNGQNQFVFGVTAEGYSRGAISWSNWRP